VNSFTNRLDHALIESLGHRVHPDDRVRLYRLDRLDEVFGWRVTVRLLVASSA
jgi:hypothetical protein